MMEQMKELMKNQTLINQTNDQNKITIVFDQRGHSFIIHFFYLFTSEFADDDVTLIVGRTYDDDGMYDDSSNG